MLGQLRLLSLVFTPLFALACVPARTPGLEPYVFDLEWEGKASADVTPVKYVVFEETLCITEGIPHSFMFSRAAKERLSEHESSRLDCLVPVRSATAVAPKWMVLALSVAWPLVVGTTEEYRLTVFCPEYRAETVYPPGFRFDAPEEQGEEDEEATDQRNCPQLMDWAQPGGVMRRYNASISLPCTRQPDGFHSRLFLRRVDTETTYHDVYGECGSFLQGEGSEADSGISRDVFAFQIERLAEAIAKRRLNRVDADTRKIVLEAIRQQHDAIAAKTDKPFPNVFHGPHAGRFDDCIHRKGSPCKIVAAWAARTPSER